LYSIAATRMLMGKPHTQYLKIRYSDGVRVFKLRFGNEIVSGNGVSTAEIAGCAYHLVEIARALKKPVGTWDRNRDPIFNEGSPLAESELKALRGVPPPG